HDLAAMHLYGDFPDRKIGGDLLVEPPRYHKTHHLSLSRAQTLVTELKLRQLLLIFQPTAIPRMAKRNRIKQFLVAKWLCQELDCTAFHRLYRHGYVAMPGNEDDWQLPRAAIQ